MKKSLKGSLGTRGPHCTGHLYRERRVQPEALKIELCMFEGESESLAPGYISHPGPSLDDQLSKNPCGGGSEGTGLGSVWNP